MAGERPLPSIMLSADLSIPLSIQKFLMIFMFRSAFSAFHSCVWIIFGYFCSMPLFFCYLEKQFLLRNGTLERKLGKKSIISIFYEFPSFCAFTIGHSNSMKSMRKHKALKHNRKEVFCFVCIELNGGNLFVCLFALLSAQG